MRVQFIILWATWHFLAAAQTPPGFAPAVQQGLNVIFNDQGKTLSISGGMLVSPRDTILPPAVLLLDHAVESFFLIMLDLDIAVNATFRTDLVQWMAQGLVNEPSSQNLSAASTEQESIVRALHQPQPNARYRQTPLRHSALYAATAIPVSKTFDYLNRPTNETLRAAFNVTTFAAAAGLGEPVGATYWLEQSVNATRNGTTGPTGSSTGSAAASRTLGPGAGLTPVASPFTGTGHRSGSGTLLMAGVSAVCAVALVLV